MPRETQLDKAIVLIKANKAAKALVILEQLAKIQPENPDVFPWLAQGYLNCDRLAEGRIALDTALKLNLPCKVTVPVVLSYAQYYAERNDFVEADKLFNSAKINCNGADLQQGQASLYMAWSNYDQNNNKLDDAVMHLEKAYEIAANLDKKLKDSITNDICELYRQLAGRAEINGDKAKAILLLEKSLYLAEEPVTRMQLGNLYNEIGEINKATEHYRHVCVADPNNLEARHRLIELFLKKDNLFSAREALLELIEKEKSVENYQLLATVALKTHSYALSVRALEEASALSPKEISLLEALQKALLDWSNVLSKQGKTDESISVKGKAQRVFELIKEIQKEENKDLANKTDAESSLPPGVLPVSLFASRIWLAKGSLTPEGEIQVKNIANRLVNDLSLTVVFYDNTVHRAKGSVTVSAASLNHPMPPHSIRNLYFSCPNIVNPEHQLAVIIYWKGQLIKELPVVKVR
jgi:tetratricopeptide (TPR) repeat protein